MQTIENKTPPKRLKELHGEGPVYKNPDNFAQKSGVCYIPALSDEEYTYQDFLSLCGGNEDMAEHVFELVDWQHPESLIECDLADIGVLPCESCSYLYDTQTMDYCPRCGRSTSENE